MTFRLTTLNRLPGLFLLLALAGMTGNSHALAASYNLVGETIEFQPPEEYCLLDQSDERERPLFQRMERLQQKGGNQLLTIFAICDELSQISHAQASGLNHYGMLVTILQKGEVKPIPNATRFDVFHELRQKMDDAAMQSIASKGTDNLKQENILLNPEVSSPTIEDEDPFALYTSMVIRRSADDPGSSVAIVYATTLVKQFAFAVYLYSPQQEPQTKEMLLAIQKLLLADFVKANESAEEEQRQTRTGQSFLGIDWEQALVKAIIAAIIAGFVGLMRRLIGRHRAKKTS